MIDHDYEPTAYIARQYGPATGILDDGSARYLAGYRKNAEPGVVFAVESLRRLKEQMLQLAWEPDEIGAPVVPAMMERVA